MLQVTVVDDDDDDDKLTGMAERGWNTADEWMSMFFVDSWNDYER